MFRRGSLSAAIAAFALAAAMVAARAADQAKYPDWQGQWVRIGGGGSFDPTKPPGRGQQPPLTPAYQAIWESHLKEAAAGGQNYNPQAHCLPGGMPRMMIAFEPMEFIVTPKITYVAASFGNEFRRIYTDGRARPANVAPSFAGYSIGRWIDENGDGRYDVLEVETTDLKGPRHFDSSGIPMAEDGQTVIKERIYTDKSNPDIIRDEITTSDHALTRPWMVTRGFLRDHKEVWFDNICAESNQYVFIAGETYLVSVDGFLMPTEKGELPPDLKNFDPPPK